MSDSVTYVQKYFADLFFNAIIDAYDNGLISNADDFLDYISKREDISNYYVMTLAVIADTMEDVYYDMTDVYESNKVGLALGSDLDSIDEMIGCPRPQATRSSLLVTFSLGTTAESSVTIPSGTIVTGIGANNRVVNFTTVEDGLIPVGSDCVNVYCLSTDTGSGTRILSNSVTGVDTTFIDDVGGITVKNNEASSGGTDTFTDDEYRALLLEWVQSNVKGSSEAYYRYFTSFDGLDSYKLIPNWNGSGTLKIVLDPGYPYQLQQAYDGIRESVCQCPDDITMFAPNRVPLNIYAKCNVDIDMVNPYSSTEKEEIRSRIVDGVKLFVDGDTLNYMGLGLGEDFIPYQLGVFLYERIPELKSIIFTDSEGVEDSSPVTITDEEIGFSKEINIIME